MSIKNRIEKAVKDFQQEDYENALFQSLIAVAATSKKRYPLKRDGDAFKQYLKDEFLPNLQPNISIKGGFFRVPYKGKAIDIETLLYKYIRCHYIHQSELAPNIVFSGPETGFNISSDENNLILNWGVIEILVRIVVESPENSNLFVS